MSAQILHIHDFMANSKTNGPGARAVVWVQGCSLGCPGCFNAQTHPSTAGESVTVDVLFARIKALESDIEGVTISGGEPLQQPEAIIALLKRIRSETALSVILFSGYRREEIEENGLAEALQYIDVLIAGRYVARERIAYGLRGSSNKTFYFITSRYTEEDLENVPHGEIVITPEGEILISGIDPLFWPKINPR